MSRKLLGFAITGLVVLSTAVHVIPMRSLSLPLHYNTSGSLPKGLYRVQWHKILQRGELLRVCVPQGVAEEARARGYVGPGNCDGGTTPVGKMVAGLPGDTVHVEDQYIRVGNRPAIPAVLQERDTRGRCVQNAKGTHILGANECFVISTYSTQSYDSRYFGPVTCAPPFLIMEPLSPNARLRLKNLAERERL